MENSSLYSEFCGGYEVTCCTDEKGITRYEQTSKLVKGPLILQTFSDRDYRRITFTGMNAVTAAGKRLWKMVNMIVNPSPQNMSKVACDYAQDQLCHFDFSEEDIRSGKKRIHYQIEVMRDGGCTFEIICFDTSISEGRQYFFKSGEDATKFAASIGLDKAILIDENGAEAGTVELSTVEDVNLGTLLLLMATVYPSEDLDKE